MAASPQGVRLPVKAVDALRARLPEVSDGVVDAVVAEVPSYSRAFAGPMGDTIRRAVGLALDGFLVRIAPRPTQARVLTAEAVRDGAYDLGRGEARSGRSMDALLAAYRVGARVAWRELSQSAVAAGLSAEQVVEFAEAVFAYIDELSAVSVAGHSDELETTGRVRQRLRERLARMIIDGARPEALTASALRAEWEPPQSLTAVVLPPPSVRPVITALGPVGGRTLVLAEEVADQHDERVTMLVPDVVRPVLERVLSGRGAVIGPPRPWQEARESYTRAVRTHEVVGDADGPVHADDHLAALVTTADRSALDDLRTRVLAPLDRAGAASRDKLEETLRAWLLCQGRRDQVAELLFVHPQTVRYRVGRLRELFGDSLTDPVAVHDLVVALGVASLPSGPGGSAGSD